MKRFILWKNIHTKIGVMLLIMVTLVLTLYGIYQYQQTKSEALRQLNAFADHMIQRLPHQLVMPLWEVEPSQIALTIASEMSDPRLFAVFVEEAAENADSVEERPYLIKQGKIRNEQGKIVGTSEKPGDPDLLVRRADISGHGQKIGVVTIFVTPKIMQTRLHEARRQIVQTIVVLNAVLIACVLFIMNRMMIRSVMRIVHAVNRLAVGDLSVRLSLQDITKQDEIGKLAYAINQLIEMTSETASVAEEIAAGNLGRTIIPRSDHDRLLLALHRMIHTLNRMLNETRRLIQEVHEGKTDVHCDAEAFEGGWRDLLIGMNTLITTLRQAEQRVIEEHHLLRTLIDVMPDFIYLKDKHHRLLLANKAVVQSSGASALTDILGKTDLDLLAPDMAHTYYANEQAILETAQALINCEEPCKDQRTGKKKWLLTTKVPFRDTQGHIAGLVGISRDITELKLAYEQLEALNQELEARVEARTRELQETNHALQQSLRTLRITQDHLVQAEKMAALGTLVTGIAHEINTPLGIGITAASYFEQESQKIQRVYAEHQMTRTDFEKFLHTAGESAGMIVKNLRRTAELIQSFKMVAVDQVSSEQRMFNLREYINELLISLQPKLRATSHSITFHCPPDIEITSYPGTFSQILTNLVFNSLIHAFGETTEGNIAIEVTKTQETLRICYSDNGCGITPEERVHIYDPFYTTKRGQGSTGLGLHIVYNLVTQQLGGHITCESSLGEGIRFVMEFPVE